MQETVLDGGPARVGGGGGGGQERDKNFARAVRAGAVLPYSLRERGDCRLPSLKQMLIISQL